VASSETLVSADACTAVFQKLQSFVKRGTAVKLILQHRMIGAADWASNRMRVSSQRSEVSVQVELTRNGAMGAALTSRLDDDGLLQAVRDAEHVIQYTSEQWENIADPFIDTPILTPQLWSNATANFDATARTDVMHHLVEPATRAGLLSTGLLQTSIEATATLSSEGLSRYYRSTGAECSITVRDVQGTASGWAGVNHYALEKIDPQALATQALDRCQRSVKPVAAEPGRYTVILSPQAVADLFEETINYTGRFSAEHGYGPFAGKELGRSKITEQVMDRRLMLRSDPMDVDGGFLPYDIYTGDSYRPTDWIDRGVLRELSYERDYALSALGLDQPLSYPSAEPRAFRLAPAPGVPTSTLDEMIGHTDRGIFVTRLHNVVVMDPDSMLCTGYTRDGLWLIEDGKISKSIKNFRFTESPLFVLNNVEEIGVPQRVYSNRGWAYVAPAIRVRDFSFTSLADAV